MSEQPRRESFSIQGGELIDRIKQLIHEGNVRRVIIKQGDQTIVEFPLTIGVIGAAVARSSRPSAQSQRWSRSARSKWSEPTTRPERHKFR